MSKKTGGPAFPIPATIADKQGEQGLSIRDYFAAKAMQAEIMSGNGSYESVCQSAYKFSDAMLVERDK